MDESMTMMTAVTASYLCCLCTVAVVNETLLKMQCEVRYVEPVIGDNGVDPAAVVVEVMTVAMAMTVAMTETCETYQAATSSVMDGEVDASFFKENKEIIVPPKAVLGKQDIARKCDQ